MTEAADRSNSLVVPVVVDQGNVSFHGRSGKQQISWRDSAMITATSQGQLRLPGMKPEAGRHRGRLESREATGDLVHALLIRGKASQLKDNQIADQHQSCLYRSVEPLSELRKASVSDPGPNACIEKSGAIELRRLQPCHGTQERSRPAATS